MKYTVFVELLSGDYTNINLNDWDKAISSLNNLVKNSKYRKALIVDNCNDSIVLSLKEIQ